MLDAQSASRGNPLNEVRLDSSILQNRGGLAADKTIKYQPEESILTLQVGNEIKLTEAGFVLLFRPSALPRLIPSPTGCT